MQHTDSAGKQRWNPILLFAALGAAAVLRFSFLAKESLWLDEIASWKFAQSLGTALSSEPTNPPVFYILLHFWIAIFGDSEAAMRSLSAVFGILSVGMLYVLTAHVSNRRIASIAAIYLSFSSFHVYYSQEVRCFALLTLLILATTYCYLRLLEAPRWHWAWWCAHLFLGSLSLYTHFIAAFFLAAQGIHTLLYFRHKLWRIASSGAVILLLFAPWLRIMFATMGKTGQVRRYLVLKFPQAVFSFVYGDTLVPLDEAAVTNMRATLVEYAPMLGLSMLGLALLAPLARRWWRCRPLAQLALSMGLFPMLLALLVSIREPIFDERYLIGSSPFFYMMLAAAAAIAWEKMADWMQWAGRAGTVIVALLVLTSLGQYYFNLRFGREQWRELYGHIGPQIQPTDMVLFEADWLSITYDYYVRQHPAPALRITPAVHDKLLPGQYDASLVAGHPRLWFIYAHATDSSVLDSLRRRYRTTWSQHYPKGKGIDAYLLEAAP